MTPLIIGACLVAKRLECGVFPRFGEAPDVRKRGNTAHSPAERDFARFGCGHAALRIWTLRTGLLLAMSMILRADQFDTLRLYWQNYLISNGGSPSSIASTANSNWSAMNTNSSRTYLWSDLPLD